MLVMTSYNASKIITPLQVCVFELMVWNLELYLSRHSRGPFFFSRMKLPKNKRSEYKKRLYVDIECFSFKCQIIDYKLDKRFLFSIL